MKIGDEVYVHGYVDEIRADVVIIRNEGGYFGTVTHEIRTDTHECVRAEQTEPQKKCHRDEEHACHVYPNDKICNNCKLWHKDEPLEDEQTEPQTVDWKDRMWTEAVIEPQTDCYVSDLCKHYGDKQICGRCRSRNLFCEAETQPRCPKCGKRGYIRSLESMGVKLKVFDEYKWKCTNCNKYFKEEPKDEPQTCEECEHWNDIEDGCADRHGCKTEPQTDCSWK